MKKLFTQYVSSTRVVFGVFFLLFTVSHLHAQPIENTPSANSQPLTQAAETPASAPVTDIVLLIDNSSHMLALDPDRQLLSALYDFIAVQEETAQLALISIGEKANVLGSLGSIHSAANAEPESVLGRIDYSEALRNNPAGLERALYELKLYSTEKRHPGIIFISSGATETGDTINDEKQTDWMRNELAAQAKNQNIRIYGIAFGEQADLPLIQSLAQQTDAEYYRAETVSDFPAVLELISRNIQQTIIPQPIPEPEPKVDISPSPLPAEVPPPPATKQSGPEIQSTATTTQADDAGDTGLQYALYAMAALLVVVIAVVLIRHRSQGSQTIIQTPGSVMPNAKLVDTFRITGKPEYPITTTITQIGRVKGNPIPDVSYLVIDQKSISRHHAVIEYRNLAFWVMDQGSGNGTKLNGSLITEERRLKHGDTLLFDNHEFSFHEAGMENIDATVVQPSDNQATAGATAFDMAFEDVDKPPPQSEKPAEAPADAQAPDPAASQETDPFMDMAFETDEEAGKTTTDSEPAIIENEDGEFQPNQTMTPDEFDRLFAEIDEAKKK